MSTLFEVILSPYNGSIVTIDQLSFVIQNHSMNGDHMTSMDVPSMKVVFSPTYVIYVELSPMDSISIKKDTIFS